jgi:bifunctional non-homologous end joining protein LigD
VRAVDSNSETWHLAGRDVHLSHLSKEYWPEEGLTKRDLLRYYQVVAPTLLRYVAERPVTVRIFPDGIHGSSYYRRTRPANTPSWIRGVDYQPRTAAQVDHLILVDDEASLLWLVNRGAIELHVWSSRRPRLDLPDQAIFDLDPGERATFANVGRVAGLVRAELARLGLHGYPKTSGGRGMHICVPLALGPTFEQVRAWVNDVGNRLVVAHPDLVAMPEGATHRGDRVTIDAAQNSLGRNTAAPYTVRALPGAPVSAPMTWEEVEAEDLAPSSLNLRTMPDRLVARGDLFAPTLHLAQRLTSPFS